MIDFTKRVQCGTLPIRILCTDRPGAFPVVGMTPDGVLSYYHADGSAPYSNCLPLTQAPETVKIGIWRHKQNGQYHSGVIQPETKQTCPKSKTHGGKYELVKVIEVEVSS